MTKFINWDVGGFERDKAAVLYRDGINALVSVFLTSRGINTIEDARVMVGEIPGEIYDPFLLKDIDKAITRIKLALDSNERIAVYGDYDVDGMTSCTILALWLNYQNANFEVYIPDRIKEGYCLNEAALDSLTTKPVSSMKSCRQHHNLRKQQYVHYFQEPI